MAEVELHLILPRDARYVSLLRDVARSLLRGLDVPEESVDDVGLALSEACSNVIRHAEGTNEYGVVLTVASASCEVEVCDLGPGFDGATLGAPGPGTPDQTATAEDGRGLALLRALTDELQFVRDHDTTRVRLVKRWDAVGLG
jgi:serine/threonine-protein kinase RsbW